MTLSFAEHIETIANDIAAFTSVSVTLGMPDRSETGLHLFPYNFFANEHARNTPVREAEPQTVSSYFVKCLLISGSSVDYLALNKGCNYIHSNPVLTTSTGTIKITPEHIPTQELTSLFNSAGARFRLSIPFELRYVAN